MPNTYKDNKPIGKKIRSNLFWFEEAEIAVRDFHGKGCKLFKLDSDFLKRRGYSGNFFVGSIVGWDIEVKGSGKSAREALINSGMEDYVLRVERIESGL